MTSKTPLTWCSGEYKCQAPLYTASLQVDTVEITETLSRLVSIEAENPDEAERLVREKYKSCEIVLDADDFQDYDTSVYE